MPDIYWLIKAQWRFQKAIIPPGAAGVMAEIFTKVCKRLAATYPEAKAVIVRDRLQGYRSYRDRHILLVEVIHRTRRTSTTSAGGESRVVVPERSSSRHAQAHGLATVRPDPRRTGPSIGGAEWNYAGPS